MSQENFPFLDKVKNPHIVANYLKRLLRDMKTPIIPFELYAEFGKLGDIDNEE